MSGATFRQALQSGAWQAWLQPAAWRHGAARLGLPGWVGIGLLAFTAWGEWVEAPAIRQETASLHRSWQARTRELSQLRADPRQAVAVSPQQALDAIYGRLVPHDGRSAALAALLSQAQAAGLQVQAVSYRAQEYRAQAARAHGPSPGSSADGLPGVVRHEVALPVRGPYPALREWLAQSLGTQPALSLDALQIKRSDALADTVDARISLSLWVREGRDQAGGAR